jgi:hypothetical protein
VLVVWLEHLAWLLLNLSLLALVKLKWPDTLVGETIAVIA